MVNVDKQPHGFGRAIAKTNFYFIDGQFKEGVPHGYSRVITYDGECEEEEYHNGIR